MLAAFELEVIQGRTKKLLMIMTICASTKICAVLLQMYDTLACSLFLVMRSPITLLKKLASSGFNGTSPSRKLYTLHSRESSPDKASVIWFTSEVKSSQAVFGYLEHKIKQVEHLSHTTCLHFILLNTNHYPQ